MSPLQGLATIEVAVFFLSFYKYPNQGKMAVIFLEIRLVSLGLIALLFFLPGTSF